MIPNTPNRYGERGIWITAGEWARTVAVLRSLVLAVDRDVMIFPSEAFRESVEQARGILWVLTGEAVGRRRSAPSGDRS